MLIPDYYGESKHAATTPQARAAWGWASLAILILWMPWVAAVTVVDLFLIGGGPNGFSTTHSVIHGVLVFCPLPLGTAYGFYAVENIRHPKSIPGAIGFYIQLIITTYVVLGITLAGALSFVHWLRHG